MLTRQEPAANPLASPQFVGTQPLPRAFALLKLLFLPFPLPIEAGEVIINREPPIIQLLRAGRVAEACQIAVRCLRSCGLKPLPCRSSSGANRDKQWLDAVPLNGPRLAAALLFPVSPREIRVLRELALRCEELETPTA